jgi:nickel-type superoxide dismutase maturation protease
MGGTQTYHAPAERRRPTFALVAALGAAAAIGTAWFRWRPFRVEVEGESMRPTLAPGDWLVATRAGRVRPRSIVVVEHPARPGILMIKRVRCLPGDVDPTGTKLGPEEYWIVGDRPEASTDSRVLGPVPRSAIRGVARLRYGPASRFGAVS